MNPAISMAPGVLPALIATVFVPPVKHPDSELISVCDEIIRLETWMNSEYPKACTLEDEKQFDARMAPFREQVAALLDHSCSLTAITAAGHAARARVIAKLFPQRVDNPKDDFDVILGALLADMTAGGAA